MTSNNIRHGRRGVRVSSSIGFTWMDGWLFSAWWDRAQR